jgi:hypothetical protein
VGECVIIGTGLLRSQAGELLLCVALILQCCSMLKSAGEPAVEIGEAEAAEAVD